MDFDRPTRREPLFGTDLSPSTPSALSLRSGCVGGGSGGKSESVRGGVREGDALGDANRLAGVSGGIGGTAGRLNGDNDAFATCSNDRTDPPTVEAGGLRFRLGGRDGTRLWTAVRSPELVVDDAELLTSLVGLMLRVRFGRESVLLLSTSITRSRSSFCSAFFRLCAMRVAWRDCWIRGFVVFVDTLREAVGSPGTGGGGSRCCRCCWALMEACRGGGRIGGLRGGKGGILLS